MSTDTSTARANPNLSVIKDQTRKIADNLHGLDEIIIAIEESIHGQTHVVNPEKPNEKDCHQGFVFVEERLLNEMGETIDEYRNRLIKIKDFTS